jgi:eukaryotic translation initiation factor 2-alpha kinase 4
MTPPSHKHSLEVSRQELVGWLQSQIAEQKRIDTSNSGAPSSFESSQGLLPNKDVPSTSDVQLMLPGDAKKQRKQTKQLFLDRGVYLFIARVAAMKLTILGLAFDAGARVKSAIQSGMPLLAIDVPTPVFDAMTRSSSWITEEDQWRSILTEFPTQHSAYANQLREAVLKRKSDGHHFILLFGVKEERVHLLNLL